MKNTSVRQSFGDELARSRSPGASFQKVALSIMVEVADHQPVQVGQAQPLQAAVRRADSRDSGRAGSSPNTFPSTMSMTVR